MQRTHGSEQDIDRQAFAQWTKVLQELPQRPIRRTAYAGLDWRFIPLIISVLAHATLFVLLIHHQAEPKPEPPSKPMELVFVEILTRPALAPAELEPVLPAQSQISPNLERPQNPNRRLPERPVVLESSAPIDEVLFDREPVLNDLGRPNISQELLDDIARADSPNYRVPGLDTADSVFDRPSAIEYRESMFAHAWDPEGTLFDQWIRKMVEATSGKVEVPLNSKFRLVCQASIAGLGGGCAIVRNSGLGKVENRPSPPPWERTHRVQCREFSQLLEDAESEQKISEALELLSRYCSDLNEIDAAK